ncbi:hypothetical protein TPA0907_42190 [Micromonospora humidisoli]|nr:hypothetical protein TPA0907_42190 [Micromonospora sp. AKA109]
MRGKVLHEVSHKIIIHAPTIVQDRKTFQLCSHDLGQQFEKVAADLAFTQARQDGNPDLPSSLAFADSTSYSSDPSVTTITASTARSQGDTPAVLPGVPDWLG